MADTARLEAAIRGYQQQSQAARRQYAALHQQSQGIQQEIAKLEQELAGLRSFESTAQRDLGDMESQLMDRCRIIERIGSIQEIGMARQLADRIMSTQFTDAKMLLGRGQSMVSDEIQGGKHNLECRIAELRQQLAQVQYQMAQQQDVAAQCDRNAQISMRDLQVLRASEQ